MRTHVIDSRPPANSRRRLSIFLLILVCFLITGALATPEKTQAFFPDNRHESVPNMSLVYTGLFQSDSTPSPAASVQVTETPRKNKAQRTPRPTSTPIPIPPPTDPANLNFIIFLGIMIVGIVITGILINRHRIEP